MERLSREEMARRVAIEMQDGFCVNLGIGMPTLVANYIPKGRLVLFQSENGILGVGPAPAEGADDPDLGNAGGMDVTLVPGASCFDSATSFAMIRGGHLDVSVLGAFQVSERGDIANWKTPGRKVGSYGGALDLAAGAKKLVVLMEHTTKTGEMRVLKKCTYPLTGVECVNVIVTDIAVIDVKAGGLTLREVAPGWTPEAVQELTEPVLDVSNVKEWKRM